MSSHGGHLFIKAKCPRFVVSRNRSLQTNRVLAPKFIYHYIHPKTFMNRSSRCENCVFKTNHFIKSTKLNGEFSDFTTQRDTVKMKIFCLSQVTSMLIDSIFSFNWPSKNLTCKYPKPPKNNPPEI